MKKSNRKILAILLAVALILPFSAKASAQSSTNQVSNSEIVKYLIKSGYPEDLIEFMDYDSKLDLYLQNAQYESSTMQYGILTEDFQIFYELDENSNVIMSQESYNAFILLLQDEESMSKVYDHKETTKAMYEKTNATNFGEQIDKQELQPELTENSKVMVDLADGSLSAAKSNIFDANTMAIKAIGLTNFVGSLTCSHLSYVNNVVKKNLKFTWTWDYLPIFHMDDMVGIAWSDGFTSEVSSIKFSQSLKGYAGYYPYIYDYNSSKSFTWGPFTGSGAYTQYDPGQGVGNKFTLYSHVVDSSSPYGHWVAQVYSGSFSTNILKTYSNTSENPVASARARYFHNTFSITGGSISFSGGSLSAGVGYDSSNDFAVDFRYKN